VYSAAIRVATTRSYAGACFAGDACAYYLRASLALWRNLDSAGRGSSHACCDEQGRRPPSSSRDALDSFLSDGDEGVR